MRSGWLTALALTLTACSGAQRVGDGAPLAGLAGDVAVVGTADKLVAFSLDGKQRVLAPEPVAWCAVDNMSRVVWYAVPAGGERLMLKVADLTTGDSKEVAGPFPKPDIMIVDRDAGERIGQRRAIHYRVGLMLSLSGTPRLAPRVGCDGDLKWKCYVDATEGRPELKAPLQAMHDAYSTLSVRDGAYLTSLYARGARKEQWSERPDPRSAARVTAVPEGNCADAEDCGQAHFLPGIDIERVVVKTSKESFADMTYQLYDPATQEFFSALEPAQRSKTPLALGSAPPDLYIAPSGKALMAAGRIVPVQGAGQPNVQGRVSCGWVGGGHFVAAKP